MKPSFPEFPTAPVQAQLYLPNTFRPPGKPECRKYGGGCRWPATSQQPGTLLFPMDLTGPLSYGPNGDEKKAGALCSTAMFRLPSIGYTSDWTRSL